VTAWICIAAAVVQSLAQHGSGSSWSESDRYAAERRAFYERNADLGRPWRIAGHCGLILAIVLILWKLFS